MEGERPHGERTPSQSTPAEQLTPHHEGRNGSLGLPRTVHESAKPPPEGRERPTLPQKSALNRAVERTRNLYERNGWVFVPLPEVTKFSLDVPLNLQNHSKRPAKDEFVANPTPLFIDENQKQGMISDEERATPHREEGTVPRITSANVGQFLQELEKREQAQQEAASQEQEREEIEESLRKLKAFKTMSQRIDYLVDPPLEHLKKLWEHDKEYMYPILKGLVRRNDRIKKRDRLYYRLTAGDMSGHKPPDYTALSMSLDEWYIEHPEQFRKIYNSPNYRLLELKQDLSYAVDRAGDEDCDELSGIQNALTCEHDFLSALHEAGVEIPQVVTRIHRRLEKRRAHLDPDRPKDRHL